MQIKVPDSYEINLNQKIDSDTSNNPDPIFERNKQKHRNTIETLNHYFRVCTHPFALMLTLIALGSAFCVFYILSESTETNWASHTAGLLGKILSYVATAVFSSIFTWFMENHDKLKQDSDS